MITWVSERSGMASSGIVRIATIPPMTRPKVVSRTMNLFFSEKSMSDFSMAVSVRVPVVLFHPMLLGDFPVLHFAGFNQVHAALRTLARPVGDHVRMRRHRT